MHPNVRSGRSLVRQTLASAGRWTVRLDDGLILRQATQRDRLAVNWLLNTSPWTHRVKGWESLPELLTCAPSLAWRRGRTMRGALLCSLYRDPVAEVRYLALRARGDVERFFGGVLPVAEERLQDLGARWISFRTDEEWLRTGLADGGYFLQDEVVSYRRESTGLDICGSRAVKVRAGYDGDLEAALAVDSAAFVPFWRLNATVMAREIDQSPWYLLAEATDGVVGYLIAQRWGLEAYISRIGVLPAHQGIGIGTRLMCEALDLMRRDGLSSVRLNTQVHNGRSRRLYERLGFTTIGAPVSYWVKELQD